MRERARFDAGAGYIAVLFWAIIVGVEIAKGGRWAWSLRYILLSTPLTVIATVLLCRLRRTRNKALSYGTLLAGPFGSAIVAIVFWQFYYCGMRVLTADYWLEAKGGVTGYLIELALIGGVSVLPAIGIVIYHQRLGKSDDSETPNPY